MVRVITKVLLLQLQGAKETAKLRAKHRTMSQLRISNRHIVASPPELTGEGMLMILQIKPTSIHELSTSVSNKKNVPTDEILYKFNSTTEIKHLNLINKQRGVKGYT